MQQVDEMEVTALTRGDLTGTVEKIIRTIKLMQACIAELSGVSRSPSMETFLALSKKKRPEGLFQLAIPSVIIIFINRRRNEIEIILFAAGIAECFFPVREIDNPIGFVDFLIAFWASRRKFREHDFLVTDVGCMAHNASSWVLITCKYNEWIVIQPSEFEAFSCFVNQKANNIRKYF